MARNLYQQLCDLFQNLPVLAQMYARDWRAFFLGQIGLARSLDVQVDWSGSEQAIVHDLLEHVIAEGQIALLSFCRKFDDEHICGSDQRMAIRRLISEIAQLSAREWEQEFAIQRYGVSLNTGAQALLRQDYSQALAQLKQAVNTIPASERRLAARARYLQALALLGKDLPRDKPETIRERVEELLEAALKLERCWAFLFTLAAIKKDIYAVAPSSSQWQEVYYWQRQLGSVSRTAYDDELLFFLERCQFHLYHQTW
jgi:hypothetical protein